MAPGAASARRTGRTLPDAALDRFFTDLGRHAFAERIARDVRSADASNVSGTPAFFINGRRYAGAFDLNSLAAELAAALGSTDLLVAGPRIGEPVAVAA